MQKTTSNVARHLWLGALAFSVLVATTTMPCIGYAQPSTDDISKGRELAKEAYTAFKSKEFDKAVSKFKQASKLYPSGQVLRYRGYSLLALERWAEAVAVLERALKTTIKPLSPVEAEDTEDQIKQAKTHIAILSIRSKTPGATARIGDGDAKRLPHRFLLKPGDIEIVVEAQGYDTRSESREAAAGSEQSIGFDLKKKSAIPTVKKPAEKKVEPPPEPSEPINLFAGWFPHQGTIGLATAGLGLAAGAVALGTGLHGLSIRSAVQENIDAHNSNYDAQCAQNSQLCQYDIALINNDGQRAKSYQNIGLITGIVGASLFAVGTTFWIFAPDGPIGNSEDNSDGKDRASIGCLPTMQLSTTAAASVFSMSCGGSF